MNIDPSEVSAMLDGLDLEEEEFDREVESFEIDQDYQKWILASEAEKNSHKQQS